MLADVSTEFQVSPEKLDITKATNLINDAKRGIEANYLGEKMAWGKYTRRFLGKISGLSAIHDDDAELSLTIAGTKVEVTPAKVKEFYNFARELALAVKMALGGRFPDFELLEAFRIFDAAELLKSLATVAAEAKAAAIAGGKSAVEAAEVAKAAKEASLASYGDEQIERLADFYGAKGAIIDGDSRVFDGGAVIDQWRTFRTGELWNKRHMEWRPMCKELLLDEVRGGEQSLAV